MKTPTDRPPSITPRRRVHTAFATVAVAGLLAVLATACGDDGPPPTPTTTTAAPTTTTEAPTTVASSTGARQKLTIRPVLSSGPCATVATTGTDPITPGATISVPAQADGSYPLIDGIFCYQLGDPAGDGNDLKDATVARNGDTWQVLARPRSDSVKALNTLFNACLAGEPTCPAGEGGHGYAAFVWKGAVLLAPAVSAEDLADGPILLASGLDERTARDLAGLINYG